MTKKNDHDFINSYLSEMDRFVLDLKHDLRDRAEILLDNYIKEKKELTQKAISDGKDPSYVQFFILMRGRTLEFRWGTRTGKKTDNGLEITNFLSKGTGIGYTKPSLKKISKGWDYPIIEKYEDELRLLREINHELKHLTLLKNKLNKRYQKLGYEQ